MSISWWAHVATDTRGNPDRRGHTKTNAHQKIISNNIKTCQNVFSLRARWEKRFLINHSRCTLSAKVIKVVQMHWKKKRKQKANMLSIFSPSQLIWFILGDSIVLWARWNVSLNYMLINFHTDIYRLHSCQKKRKKPFIIFNNVVITETFDR